MTAKDKCIWMIELLRQHPEGLTRKQIGEYYHRDGFKANYTTFKDGRSRYEIPRSTFSRILRSLKELYNITIDYNPNTYCYRLADSDEEAINRTSLWMAESYGVNQSMKNDIDMRRFVMIDGAPTKGNGFNSVVKAIMERRTMTVPYRWVAAMVKWCDFPELYDCALWFNPYGIRCYEGRWYVVGVFDYNSIDSLQDIAELYDDFSHTQKASNQLKYRELWVIEIEEDAIINAPADDATGADCNLTLSNPGKYEIPEWFDINKVYRDFVGPEIDKSVPRKPIIVLAAPKAAKLLDARPIHHTQDILREEKDGTYFLMYLRPTKYFFAEMTKYGNSIEFIEPKDLQHEYEKYRK